MENGNGEREVIRAAAGATGRSEEEVADRMEGMLRRLATNGLPRNPAEYASLLMEFPVPPQHVTPFLTMPLEDGGMGNGIVLARFRSALTITAFNHAIADQCVPVPVSPAHAREIARTLLAMADKIEEGAAPDGGSR